MSPVRSSRLAVAGVAVVAALAGCARGGGGETASAPSASPFNNGRIGYVRMEQLVRVHPLYPQLAHLDEDVAALQLTAVGPQVARSGADIAKDEHALQRELDIAAARTKKALADKQQSYAKREQAAIDAALGAAVGVGGPGGGSIENGVVNEARVQGQSVARAAAHNLDVYRRQLVEQDRTAVTTLNRSLADRAAREYRARLEELQRKESDRALELASEDSAERLSLRAKLSNLALDDASRADVKTQLDALDRKEADVLAAMKNRDQATLAELQSRLHARVQGELARDVGQMQQRTVAKINARAVQTRQQLVAQIAVPRAAGNVSLPANVAPDMRQKLETLHKQYQNDFNKDATQTIARFQKTRADLTRRFRALAGADADAQSGAARQIDALEKQRGDLYDQMVAQIGREVKLIAERRGINVVVSNVVAPAGGVDLTTDAQKDIESLHE